MGAPANLARKRRTLLARAPLAVGRYLRPSSEMNPIKKALLPAQVFQAKPQNAMPRVCCAIQTCAEILDRWCTLGLSAQRIPMAGEPNALHALTRTHRDNHRIGRVPDQKLRGRDLFQRDAVQERHRSEDIAVAFDGD